MCGSCTVSVVVTIKVLQYTVCIEINESAVVCIFDCSLIACTVSVLSASALSSLLSYTLCRQGDRPLECLYVESCTIRNLGVCGHSTLYL